MEEEEDTEWEDVSRDAAADSDGDEGGFCTIATQPAACSQPGGTTAARRRGSSLFCALYNVSRYSICAFCGST